MALTAKMMGGVPWTDIAEMTPNGPRWTGRIVVLEDKLMDPLLRIPKEPERIFVCSASDLFHPDVPTEFVDRMFDVMRQAHWHTFQILTKRTALMVEYAKTHAIPSNCWFGTTVEDQKRAEERIPLLLGVPVGMRWISAEPLLEEIHVGKWLGGLDWVAAGPEYGPDARPCDVTWLRSLRQQCSEAHTPLFLKDSIDGEIHREFPSSEHVRLSVS